MGSQRLSLFKHIKKGIKVGESDYDHNKDYKF